MVICMCTRLALTDFHNLSFFPSPSLSLCLCRHMHAPHRWMSLMLRVCKVSVYNSFQENKCEWAPLCMYALHASKMICHGKYLSVSVTLSLLRNVFKKYIDAQLINFSVTNIGNIAFHVSIYMVERCVSQYWCTITMGIDLNALLNMFYRQIYLSHFMFASLTRCARVGSMLLLILSVSPVLMHSKANGLLTLWL